MTGCVLTSDRWLWRVRLSGAVAALVMALILQVVGAEAVRRTVFDRWHIMAPRDLRASPVRIVWIDEASIRSFGSWPWSRYTLARLTEEIAAQKPKVIGFDMVFPEPDRMTPALFAALYPELPPATAAQVKALPSMDYVLAKVIGAAPVVLARAGLDTAAAKDPPSYAVEAQFKGTLPPALATWNQGVASISALDDVALGHGLINGDPDKDGVVRRVPLIGRIGKTAMPGFALELARITSDADRIDVNASALTLGQQPIRIADDGSMRIAYGELPTSAQFSAHDLLDGTIAKDALSGKTVIVALSGAGTADVVTTPVGTQSYGAIVQAAAVDAILAGKSLWRPDWAWWGEGLVAFMLIGVALFVLPRLSLLKTGLITVAVIVLLFASSAAAFVSAGLLLDPLSPTLVTLAAIAMILVMLFARAQADLQGQRLVAAKAAGELSAAREIQLGMLPQRAALGSFDKRVELDALIEPARSIGGDFYDVIRLDEHRVCFLVGDVTGKGVPAALFMALSKALTKSVLLRDGLDLAAAVTRLNEEIARDNSEDMFVTMLFGLLDTRDGRLDLCNAGHENPYHIKADGSVTLLTPEGGPPLSVAPGFPYDAETIMLQPGDSIVIVSDGITEAQNRQGSFFGAQRLEAVLKNWSSADALSGASNALLREVRAFEAGEEATDDLTVLAFRYLT